MNYQIQRRPHRRRQLSLTGVVTKAITAYGVYKVGAWAWNKWQSPNKSDEDEDGVEAGYEYGHQRHDHVNQHQYQNSATTRKNRIDSRKFMRKRKHQLHRCRLETMSTLDNFMNTLKSSIESETDFSKQTKKLKQIRKKTGNKGKQGDKGEKDKTQHNEQDLNKENHVIDQETLWNEIKIRSMTRLFSSLYAHTIMYLLLTVQIHLLGGRIFREIIDEINKPETMSNMNNNDNNSSDNGNGNNENTGGGHHPNTTIDVSVHKAVLMQTYEYFFEKGIVTLMEKLTILVEKETKKWVTMSVESGLGIVTIDDFMSTIDRIRSIERGNLFVDFIIPSQSQDGKDGGEGEDEDNELVKDIIDETLDIMESPVFEEATQECLNLSFDTMKEQLQSNIFCGDKNSIPLVNIFGKLKKITNTIYEEPQEFNEEEQLWGDNAIKFPTIYVKAMDRLNTLKELGDISFN